MTRRPILPASPLLAAPHLTATFVTAMLLTGCAAGPDFHAPAAPTQTAYDQHGREAPGDNQRWIEGAPQDGWWRAYHAPALDALIDAALASNADLAAAQATLRAARENLAATRGILLPTVDAGAGTSRSKSSQYLSPVLNSTQFTYGLQTAQVNVGYSLDLFGLNRRTVEQARAQAEAQACRTQAARITLINTVITTALLDAQLRAQIAAQDRMIAAQRQTLAIIRHQQDMGAVAGADVAAADAALAASEAALPPLHRAEAQTRDLIATLIGRTAADPLPPLPDLDAITLPADLPLGLPSQLVRQRPDVRAAEADLHAASAAIGIAAASRLPQLTLSASAGGNSAGWSSLLSAANSFWSLGAGITQPIFAGGALLHRQREARAQYAAADAQYRSTVLGAFQNVADTLAALRTDAEAEAAQTRARNAAAQSLAIAQRQYQSGGAPYAAVLAAQTQFDTAEQALAQARAARLTDTAALFEALGGGWSGA